MNTTEVKTQIAAEISRLHELAEAKAADAKGNMMEAMQAAVQCGQTIEMAKEMTKGQLLGWLRESVPGLTPQRAKAYMSLHHAAQEHGIESVDHRQLLLLGVIDQKEAVATERPVPPLGLGKWIVWAGGIRGWFSKTTKDRPVDDWTDEEKQSVRDQLEPIVAIWRALE
jgi:hypothetical protein